MSNLSHSAILASATELEFLWLELTNACNLECGHCYAKSGPLAGHFDRLSEADYRQILRQAFERGCRSVQFIGGEATLNRDLPALIEYAKRLGYEFIEVFSNLISINERLLDVFRTNGVHVATSFYSHVPDHHDAITRRRGSWKRTSNNISRMVGAGIPCRAGIIEMQENAGDAEATIELLKTLGIQHVGIDGLRPFGRADQGDKPTMATLCGSCAGKVICVGADGTVSPCIMSKAWAIGNAAESDFGQLLDSRRLAETRSDIADATLRIEEPENGVAKMCNPTCAPCQPGAACQPVCAPSLVCYPRNSDGCTPRY